MLRALKNKISDISSMKYLFLLLCAAFLLTIGIGNTFSYVMTKTPTLVNMFLNGMNPDGNLVIQKIVSHPYGDDYIIPENKVFTFDVNLGSEYANETVKTTQGEITANENGIVTVTVTPGGRATIYDIDEGTSVAVTEVLIGTGFTPDAESKDLTIQKYQDNILTFTNTYIPEKADTSALTVSGSKTLVGREWIEGDSFTFALEVNESGVWTSLGTVTTAYELVEQPDPADPEKTIVTPKPDFDRFDFTELIRSYSFEKAGSYSFRITEIEGTIGGVTYDKAESKFDILVGDADMDGYLEIQSITTTSDNTIVDGATVNITFENSYAPVGSAEAFIEIQKIVEDNSGQSKSPAGYTFELYDTEGNLLLTSDPTGSTGETSLRLVYEPTDAGKIFEYVLKESRCGETVGALTYDANTYEVKVTVVDNLDGTVSAYIYDNDACWEDNILESDTENDDSNTVSGGDAELNDASETGIGEIKVSIPAGITDTYRKTFINHYDPQDASVTLSGSKTLTGRAMNEGEFSFQLYQADALFRIPNGAQPIRTAVNGADGTFGFASLAFDKVGSYYYVAKEDTSAALGGITYDGSTYLVTVVVTDSNGVLGAAVTITDSYGKESGIVFRNSYKAAPVFLPLNGRKILNGADLHKDAFRFLIFEADETFAAQSQVLQTVTNSENGEFCFEPLSFKDAGIYRYVVTEQSGTVEGMTYDDTKYCITVQVTDPGNGQLVISEFSMTADGSSVSEILFENVYVEPDEPDKPDIPIIPDKPDKPDKPDEPSAPVIPDESTGVDVPEDAEDSEQVKPPVTDDDSSIALWISLLVLSGSIIMLLLIIRKDKRCI